MLFPTHLDVLHLYLGYDFTAKDIGIYTYGSEINFCAVANIKMGWHAHIPGKWSDEGPNVGL